MFPNIIFYLKQTVLDIATRDGFSSIIQYYIGDHGILYYQGIIESMKTWNFLLIGKIPPKVYQNIINIQNMIYFSMQIMTQPIYIYR